MAYLVWFTWCVAYLVWLTWFTWCVAYLVWFKDEAKLHEDSSLCQQWDVGGRLVHLTFESNLIHRINEIKLN